MTPDNLDHMSLRIENKLSLLDVSGMPAFSKLNVNGREHNL